MKSVFITLILGFFLIIAAAYPAKTSDLFTIDEVKVSMKAKNAKDAKEAAILNGQRQALKQLVDRVAGNSGAAVDVDNIEAQALADLVTAMEFNNEKLTPTYYSAELNISFNQELVEKLLNQNNVSYSKEQAAPIVIIPLLHIGNNSYLFEESNPLGKALALVATKNPVLTMIIPTNLRGITKEELGYNIEEYSQEMIDNLLLIGQNYKAQKVIMVAAELVAPDTLNVKVQDLTNKLAEFKEIQITPDDAKSDDIYKIAAKKISLMAENYWLKTRNNADGATQKYNLFVLLNNDLTILTKAKQKLLATNLFKQLNVAAVTVNYAQIEVFTSADKQKLTDSIQNAGFAVQEKNGDLLLKLATDLQN